MPFFKRRTVITKVNENFVTLSARLYVKIFISSTGVTEYGVVFELTNLFVRHVS